MTEVVNIKHLPAYWRTDQSYVYIGRNDYRDSSAPISNFGNPIPLGKICLICKKVHTEKGSTLECFRKYFNSRIEVDSNFKKLVLELKNKKLVCHCAPDKCHGDIIKAYLDDKEQDLF